MVELMRGQSLEKIVFEDKVKEDLIVITGYPFSGKKSIVCQMMDELQPSNFLLLYSNLIHESSDPVQRTLLDGIIKKRGVDAHELENIEDIADRVKGKTVFLLLPSRLISKKGKTGEEIKKLAGSINKIKSSNRLVLVTREYTYNYLFNSGKEVIGTQPDSVLNKMTEFFSKHLKRTSDAVLPDNEWVVKIVCKERDALDIIDNLDKKNGVRLSEETKQAILRHGRVNHGPYQGYYFPGLIMDGIRKKDEIKNESIKNIEKCEGALALESSILAALGIQVPAMLTSASAQQSIPEIVGKFTSSMSKILSVIVPGLATFGGGLAGAFVALLFANSSNKKEFGNELLKWASMWKEMPIERREYIAYQYDALYHLPPGDSLEIFGNLFGTRLRDLETKFNAFSRQVEDKIGSIEGELFSTKEEIRKITDSIVNQEMRGLELVVTKNNLKDMVFGKTAVPEDKLIVGLNSSKEDELIKEEAFKITKDSEQANITVLTGKPGSGKSTLLYIIGHILLDKGKTLYGIKDLSIASFEYATAAPAPGGYILIDLPNEEIANVFNNRINAILLPRFSKVIVSAREGYVHDRGGIKALIHTVELSTEALKAIALERVKGLESVNGLDKISLASTLVKRSEGLPVYISEAVKYISKKGEWNENEMPDGVGNLIQKILEEEGRRDHGNIIVYNLVATYSYVPERLVRMSYSILDIKRENEPRYFDLEHLGFHLHSWYKDILLQFQESLWERDEFSNTPYLPILEKDLMNIRKNFDSIKDQRLKEIKKNFASFVDNFRSGISYPENLGDMSDALLLVSIWRFSSKYLKAEGHKYGYNILKEDIEYPKLEEGEGIKRYNEISEYLLTQLFQTVGEGDVGKRVLLPIIILYSGRFFNIPFSFALREIMLNKNPNIDESRLLESAINERYPVSNYIKATSYLLYQAKLIKSPTDAGLLMMTGMYEGAVAEYNNLLSKHPNNPVYHNNKGTSLYELGKYQEAIGEYDIAISLDSANPAYHNNKGIVLDDLGRYQEAIGEYDIAISLDPNITVYHNNKGTSLYELGKYQEAIGEYDIAISLDSANPAYHNNKGSALKKLRRDQEAIGEIDIAISLGPNDPGYHYNKGISLYELGKYQEAIAEIDMAISIGPDDISYHSLKGNCLKKLGKNKEAKSRIEKP